MLHTSTLLTVSNLKVSSCFDNPL